MIKQSILALGLAFASTATFAQSIVDYEVTVTNITPGQTFTPQLVLTHNSDFLLFQLGQPASEQLEILAEGGDTAPLTEATANMSTEATTIGGLLSPGQTASTTVTGPSQGGFLTVAAMLIPTNDTFVALNRIRLPTSGGTMYLVPAYDAGTEVNSQSCQHIPGPRCGGEGYVEGPADGDEGFVHIGNGFHELGTEDAEGFEILGPQTYDWRNSVARITVRRMN
ncbi:MAG: spondin domain-containing protein [Halioglobus sp.]